VRRDAELAHARISGQDDVDRGQQPAGPPALIEDVRNRDGAEGAPREGDQESSTRK
jgi:hypothetical protein